MVNKGPQGDITFQETSYDQLSRIEALIDRFPVAMIEWLLTWSDGTYHTWHVSFDLDYFERELA